MGDAECVYPYCDGVDSKGNYFRVPEDPELRKKWMSAIPQVLDLTPESFTGRVFLCSKHFHSSHLVMEDGKITSIKSNSVPSIFYIPFNTNNDEDEEDESIGGEIQEVQEVLNVQEVPDETIIEETGMNISSPPPISSTASDEVVYLKVRAEMMKTLVMKEKYLKEQQEYDKNIETLKQAKKGHRSEEIQEAYQKAIKKMRSIAPKIPPKRKPKTFEEVIMHYRKKRLMSEDATFVLLSLFGDVPADHSKPSAVVKEALECFAQYATFYSTEIYENLDSIFDIKSLPPIELVRNMWNSDKGEPGWSSEAFNYLREKTAKSSNRKVLCSLLVGSMSIKRMEEWDGKKFRGYVDFGPGTRGRGFDMDSDGLPPARSVLVLMVVPLDPTQVWRVPVAYFFIHILSSTERANVIRECILRLHSVGSVVLSVTCDVHYNDQVFLNSLGVSCALLPQLCPYFVHPGDPLLRVQLIFDHSSLLTSVQNMWASLQCFFDAQGRNINWKFVSELIKLLEIQAGSFSQIFDSPQWCWDSSYVRNRLLAQLFSESTADAIEYCCRILNLSQFHECEGTVNFIRMMSKACKLLNSRRYMKSRPMGQDDTLKADYQLVLDYLYHLCDVKNTPLHSPSSGSIRLLYQTLLSCQELLRQVKGFSSHCLNLEEVEMVFYTIRTYTDWASIPTARQFTAAFTTHIHKFGRVFYGTFAGPNMYWRVDPLDVVGAKKEGRLVSNPKLSSPCAPTNCDIRISLEHVHPTADFRSFSAHHFIAGCIVKNVANILHCIDCIEALQDRPVSDNALLCLLRRTCGAVLCPSIDVLRVCAFADHRFNITMKTLKPATKSSLFDWEDEKLVEKIGHAVVRDLQGKDIFPSLKHHHLECAPNASHLYRLIQGISTCYIHLRLRSLKSWCPV